MLKLLLATVLAHSIQVCEVDGVMTYTDRDDVCVDGEEIELGSGAGTFSTVDAWAADMPLPVRPPEHDDERVVIERYYYPVIESQPVYRAHLPLFANRPFRDRRKRDRDDDKDDRRGPITVNPGPVFPLPGRTAAVVRSGQPAAKANPGGARGVRLPASRTGLTPN